ncbi:MAG: hypothetical protein FWC22_07895 [Treponema sp.]|nr:hypothetical protein [Treponema sp.]
MKNKIKIIGIIAVAVLIGFTMTACGGGGGGAKKSGLKTNGFFGALPAIYADHELARTAIDERLELAQQKAIKKHDIKALQKAEAQYDKDLEDLSAKLEASLKAEHAKLAGKDVPFTIGANFSDFKVNSLKIDEDGNLALSASDVKTNLIGVTQFMYRAYTKDGTVLIEYMGYGSEKLYTNQAIWSKPEGWVDFDKIEFIDTPGRNM